VKTRTTVFFWNSKRELISYFSKNRPETIEAWTTIINKEIDEAKKRFKLRQGSTINMRELWQKVGMSLVKRFNLRQPIPPSVTIKYNGDGTCDITDKDGTKYMGCYPVNVGEIETKDDSVMTIPVTMTYQRMTL
jgi:hypothetical protein